MVQRTFRTLVILLISATSAHGGDDLLSVFTEGALTGELRTYFFRRDFDSATTREDLAAGGMLYYRTAPLLGVSLGVGFYTGQDMGLN